MPDATVTIDLQEGFGGEHVTVTVADRVSIDEAVTTSLLTGLARSVTVTEPPGRVTVRALVAGGDQQCELELAPGESCHLGIALAHGQVVFRSSATPFSYG